VRDIATVYAEWSARGAQFPDAALNSTAMSASEPPIQLQSSSHRVENGHVAI
jgi:hypothetical protein